MDLQDKETPEDFEEVSVTSSSSGDSDSDSSDSSDSEEEITQEFLDSLLDIARTNAQKLSSKGKERATFQEEEVIRLDTDDNEER